MDAYTAAALDSAVRVLRHVFNGELPGDTLPEEDVMGGFLALALDNVGLPAVPQTLDALMAAVLADESPR